MVRDVGGGHALAHAIDEEQEITLKRLEHAYLVAFLQLIQICAVVFINTPTILNSSEIMMIEKVQESLKTLSIEFPDMIQVPSLSSVALLKLPRRPLFLSTTLLVCLSMASLGVFSYFQVTPRGINDKETLIQFYFQVTPPVR